MLIGAAAGVEFWDRLSEPETEYLPQALECRGFRCGENTGKNTHFIQAADCFDRQLVIL